MVVSLGDSKESLPQTFVFQPRAFLRRDGGRIRSRGVQPREISEFR